MAKRNSFDDRGDGRSNKRRKSSEHRGFDRGSSNNNNRNDNDGCGVFVGNLKYETRWQALKDHMRQAGNVNSANILEAPNGRSKVCKMNKKRGSDFLASCWLAKESRRPIRIGCLVPMVVSTVAIQKY